MGPERLRKPSYRCFKAPTYERDIRGLQKALGGGVNSVFDDLVGKKKVTRKRGGNNAPGYKCEAERTEAGKFQPLDGFLVRLAKKNLAKQKTLDGFDKFCEQEVNAPDKHGRKPAVVWGLSTIHIRRVVLVRAGLISDVRNAYKRKAESNAGKIESKAAPPVRKITPEMRMIKARSQFKGYANAVLALEYARRMRVTAPAEVEKARVEMKEIETVFLVTNEWAKRGTLDDFRKLVAQVK